MKLALENIPHTLALALTKRASDEQRTEEEVVINILIQALATNKSENGKRDLSDVIGTWQEDPAFDEALKGFEQIDDETRF